VVSPPASGGSAAMRAAGGTAASAESHAQLQAQSAGQKRRMQPWNATEAVSPQCVASDSAARTAQLELALASSRLPSLEQLRATYGLFGIPCLLYILLLIPDLFAGSAALAEASQGGEVSLDPTLRRIKSLILRGKTLLQKRIEADDRLLQLSAPRRARRHAWDDALARAGLPLHADQSEAMQDAAAMISIINSPDLSVGLTPAMCVEGVSRLRAFLAQDAVRQHEEARLRTIGRSAAIRKRAWDNALVKAGFPSFISGTQPFDMQAAAGVSDVLNSEDPHVMLTPALCQRGIARLRDFIAQKAAADARAATERSAAEARSMAAITQRTLVWDRALTAAGLPRSGQLSFWMTSAAALCDVLNSKDPSVVLTDAMCRQAIARVKQHIADEAARKALAAVTGPRSAMWDEALVKAGLPHPWQLSPTLLAASGLAHTLNSPDPRTKLTPADCAAGASAMRCVLT
jgi:hypothetical protein